MSELSHTVGRVVQRWGETLIDLVAPQRCMGCLGEGTWLCGLCVDLMILPPLSCLGCRREHPHGLTCTQCRSALPLTGVVTAASYNNHLARRGIHWLKFKGIKGVAPSLAQLLIPRLRLIAPFDQLRRSALLVPIPLHRRRRRLRGFNQSEELVKAISQATDIPWQMLLERQKSTWTQSHLPADLRNQNLHGAFALGTALPLRRRMIILVDDVITSGATLSAAASVVKRAMPATQVWGLAVARG